ncbi:hypothetical protein ACFQET_09400 [Levilactobacillus tangyuanensis]|uniref:Uncharacterized protein n=1 Tax=Levilactobacillus tangyuanensis TaxID=2486021 RepID=A0ABW1TQC3_9LACO|nr:hypothetical protein [Levilactobacillus tangyuanensis]
MRKVFGYVAGLVAALSFAGVVATTANADGNSADAASGSGSDSATMTSGADNGGGSTAPSSATSSSISSSTKWTSRRRVVRRRPVVYRLRADREMRGRLHYDRDGRTILFQKGMKGARVTLRNRRGAVVDRFTVKKNGRFDVRLSRKEALKLDRGGKYFTFTVRDHGYKPYTIRYDIKK